MACKRSHAYVRSALGVEFQFPVIRLTACQMTPLIAEFPAVWLSELAPISTGPPGIALEARGYPQDRLMSDDYQRIEIVTGTPRRRRWTAEQKLRIVEESHQGGESISAVARRRGVAANLLYRWRRLIAEGGVAALSTDEGVVSVSEVRRLEDRVRELERLLERKTMEAEILKEALERSRVKEPTLLSASPIKDVTRQGALRKH